MNRTVGLATRRALIGGAGANLLARPTGAGATRHPESLVVGGTGAALGTVRRLAAAFVAANEGVKLDLPDSLGSTGGMRAVIAGAIDVGVATRAPTPSEAAMGARSIVFARSAFAFVTSHPRPPGSLASADLTGIFALKTRNWPDGVPLRLILRPRSDGDFSYLLQRLPALVPAVEATMARQIVPVAQTDQNNLDIAESLEGSFAGATLAAVASEKRRLRALALDGVRPEPSAVQSGAYPHVRPLHFITSPTTSEAGRAFVAFALSAPARDILLDCACLQGAG